MCWILLRKWLRKLVFLRIVCPFFHFFRLQWSAIDQVQTAHTNALVEMGSTKRTITLFSDICFSTPNVFQSLDDRKIVI